MEVIIISGTGSGMGKAMVYALATCGYKLIMACNNSAKSEMIREEVLKMHPQADIELIQFDLASFASIRAFVDEVAARDYTVKVMINNAGVLPSSFCLTESGLESAIGVNYIGVFYLNKLLLDRSGLMTGNSLILNTVSVSHKIGCLNESVFSTKVPSSAYHRIFRYANSKLALLLYSLELAGRVKERGVRVLAVDPGIVSTGMIAMHKWFDPLTDIFFRPFIKTAEQGADTAVYLTLEALKGNDSRSGICMKNRKPLSLSKKTLDQERRQWLWAYTESLLEKSLP